MNNYPVLSKYHICFVAQPTLPNELSRCVLIIPTRPARSASSWMTAIAIIEKYVQWRNKRKVKLPLKEYWHGFKEFYFVQPCLQNFQILWSSRFKSYNIMKFLSFLGFNPKLPSCFQSQRSLGWILFHVTQFKTDFHSVRKQLEEFFFTGT